MKSFKDLGVTISRDLSGDNHISIAVNKANNLLGLIKRSVGTTNVIVFSTLYLSLVRPILKYAVPVWCPYLFKNIRALESIQRRASRLALNQHKGELPYVDRCKLLKWPSLSVFPVNMFFYLLNKVSMYVVCMYLCIHTIGIKQSHWFVISEYRAT